MCAYCTAHPLRGWVPSCGDGTWHLALCFLLCRHWQGSSDRRACRCCASVFRICLQGTVEFVPCLLRSLTVLVHSGCGCTLGADSASMLHHQAVHGCSMLLFGGLLWDWARVCGRLMHVFHVHFCVPECERGVGKLRGIMYQSLPLCTIDAARSAVVCVGKSIYTVCLCEQSAGRLYHARLHSCCDCLFITCRGLSECVYSSVCVVVTAAVILFACTLIAPLIM